MMLQRDIFYMINENQDWEYKGELLMFDIMILNNFVGMLYCYYVLYGNFCIKNIECVL